MSTISIAVRAPSRTRRCGSASTRIGRGETAGRVRSTVSADTRHWLRGLDPSGVCAAERAVMIADLAEQQVTISERARGDPKCASNPRDTSTGARLPDAPYPPGGWRALAGRAGAWRAAAG